MPAPDPEATLPPRGAVAPAPATRDRLVIGGAAELLHSTRLPAPGERVGSYAVVRSLARGGMGAVFVARDVAGREVALKLLLESSGTAGARLEIEGRAAARLQHPGIVRVHDAAVDERGRQFLVMDLIPGESLQARLERDGPLPPDEAATITRDVARAVQHAHDHGVVHRDLKPANILRTPDGRVVVTDFGLARVVDQTQALTRSGAMLGTPAYMPPEQVRGDRAAMGPTSDVYGLGATLYALLTAEPPFAGSTAMEMLLAVLTRPAAFATRRPNSAPALEAICLACLAKAPADRYPSAGAVADSLEAFLERRPAASAPGQRRRARRVVLVALGVVAAATSLVALAFALTRPRPEAPVTIAPAPSAPVVAALRLAKSGELPLLLPASGALTVTVDVGPAEVQVGLVLRLDRDARRPWTVTVTGPSPEHEELARSPSGGEEDLVLTFVRDGPTPLVTGAHAVRVEGPPGGRATLTARFFAPGEDPVKAPFRAGVPLPEVDVAFSEENRATAHAMLERLAQVGLVGGDLLVEEDEADVLLREGEEDALLILAEVAARDPRPLARLFITLLRVKDLRPGAEQRWRRAASDVRAVAAAMGPAGDPHVEYAQGRVLEAEGRPDEACAHLARAVSLEPRALEPRLALARCELGRGALDAAQAAARTILARDPREPRASLVLGEVELARVPTPWGRATARILHAATRVRAGGERPAALERLMSRVRKARPEERDAARATAKRVVQLLEPWRGDALRKAFAVVRLGQVRVEVVRGLALAHSGQVEAGHAHLLALREALEREEFGGVKVQRAAVRAALQEVAALGR